MSTTYRRTKTSALQSLAAAGNVEAQQELARRGEPTTSPSTDVRQMSKQDLLALVQAVPCGSGHDAIERARTVDGHVAAVLEVDGIGAEEGFDARHVAAEQREAGEAQRHGHAGGQVPPAVAPEVACGDAPGTGHAARPPGPIPSSTMTPSEMCTTRATRPISFSSCVEKRNVTARLRLSSIIRSTM